MADRVAVIIGVAIVFLVLVGVPVAGVVALHKQANRRTIRQVWAEAPHSQRWDWSVRLLYFPFLLVLNIPLLPALIRATGFGAMIILLIVGGTGYSRARRREGNPVDVAGTLRRARTHLRAVFRRS